jgi:antitoxin component of MazEF toxin-antitoxin module
MATDGYLQEEPWLRKIMVHGGSHVLILPHPLLKPLGLVKGSMVVVKRQGKGLYVERLILPKSLQPSLSQEQIADAKARNQRHRPKPSTSLPGLAPLSATNEKQKS